MIGSAAIMVLALVGQQQPAPTAASTDGARLLTFLAENRPVFVRLRVTSQGRPFEASWIDSVKMLHGSLDRNGDGTLTTKEADPKVVTALVRLATGAAVPPALGELDVHPKDGTVTIDELAEVLRPILGPFQLQVGRQAISRTDALFDQLDRDKDGELTSSELMAITGSLRPLDLDDNEMISADELEPFNSPAIVQGEESSERRARFTALPPVVELIAGESSLRPARLLLKKYDKGKGDEPGRPDGKLSPTEFAIDTDAFGAADANGDDALDTNELRKFLARPPVDLTLDVTLSPEASGGRSKVEAEAVGAQAKGTQVRRLGDRDVEFAVGQVRIDIRVEDGNTVAEEVRRILQQRFKAADANKDGYLEGKERDPLNAPQSPLAGLLEVIDRDGDGKIYLKELVEFGDRQQQAARSRLIVTTADQGRAIFGILDLDRDRRLGAREVMRSVERAMTWDANGDGRVSADEIPYHFQVNIARGGLAGLIGGDGMGTPTARAAAAAANQPAASQAGPAWFQKMDRNHDGDVSRREFLGPRDQFDRLDRDKDGLIDADEAAAKAKPSPADSSRP